MAGERGADGERGGLVVRPAQRFEQLSIEHFAELALLEPELVIFGSGARLRFAPPALLRALIEGEIEPEDVPALLRRPTSICCPEHAAAMPLTVTALTR